MTRRRSFHDLDTFRELEVLSPDRMRIDVELCGQCLIMWRREMHLKNVVDSVRVTTAHPSLLVLENTDANTSTALDIHTIEIQHASSNTL